MKNYSAVLLLSTLLVTGCTTPSIDRFKIQTVDKKIKCIEVIQPSTVLKCTSQIIGQKCFVNKDGINQCGVATKNVCQDHFVQSAKTFCNDSLRNRIKYRRQYGSF